MDSNSMISQKEPTKWQRTVASYWHWPAMALGALTILNVARELNPRKDRNVELEAARIGWHWVDFWQRAREAGTTRRQLRFIKNVPTNTPRIYYRIAVAGGVAYHLLVTGMPAYLVSHYGRPCERACAE